MHITDYYISSIEILSLFVRNQPEKCCGNDYLGMPVRAVEPNVKKLERWPVFFRHWSKLGDCTQTQLLES